MKRRLMTDLTHDEQKMLLTVSFMAAYARYTELLAIEKSVTIIPVKEQDRQDLKRLQAWWSNLGEERRSLIITWKDTLWVEIEANTAKYFKIGEVRGN